MRGCVEGAGLWVGGVLLERVRRIVRRGGGGGTSYGERIGIERWVGHDRSDARRPWHHACSQKEHVHARAPPGH